MNPQVKFRPILVSDGHLVCASCGVDIIRPGGPRLIYPSPVGIMFTDGNGHDISVCRRCLAAAHAWLGPSS